ncbi:hypothetical protein [Dissulfurispira sp.]|uniref:hypothetical protein n=1 Tax=Dissulfurispira sp. TaxID=2817609 RepID=UPI002FDA3520
MPKVSFEIPVEVKKTISKHKDIKWDKIVSDALWGYTKKIELLDSIVKKSKLSGKDAELLNKSIKKGLSGKYQGKS